MKRRTMLTCVPALAALHPLAKAADAQAAPRVPQQRRGRFYTVEHGQTIQDAIDRAIRDGADPDRRSMVLVRPGVYTENLAVYAGVDLAMEDVVLRNTQPIKLDHGASLNMAFCRLAMPSIDTTEPLQLFLPSADV